MLETPLSTVEILFIGVIVFFAARAVWFKIKRMRK